VLTWTIGDISVAAVTNIEAALPCEILYPNSEPAELPDIDWLTPYLDTDGLVRLTLQSFLVRTPDRRIVVDLCAGDQKPRAVPFFDMLRTTFLDELTAAGFGPDDVDTVAYTHLHSDHVGWGTRLIDGTWQPTFPGARHIIDRAEYGYWETQQDHPDDQVSFSDSIRPLTEAGLVDLVDDEIDLADGIRLVRTPGHTPGHRSVRIVSGDAEAVITGDLMHNPCQVARPQWGCYIDFDGDATRAARIDLLTDAAARGVLVIGTHFPAPTAGYVTADGAGFRLTPAAG
jgi:glyoxylase-like metal-dependent hydrolase (beta-lactamase superfamily II)